MRGRGRGRPRGSGARGSGARGRGRRADTQERRRHRGDEAADALSERERILEVTHTMQFSFFFLETMLYCTPLHQ